MRPIWPVLAVVALWFAAEAAAQQATISTPFQSAGDGFFERIGTSWGFSTRGFSFSFGSPINPQFGSFDPNTGLNTSFMFGQPGNGGFFNFSAAQGYHQTFSTQVPSVTLMNGQSGFVADTTLSPFVIGYVPVVGGFPTVGTLYPTMVPPAFPSVSPAALGNARVQAMREAMAAQHAAAANQLPEAPAARPPVPAKAAGKRAHDGPEQVQPAAVEKHDLAADKVTAAQASSAGRAVPSVAEARRLHELEQGSTQQQAAVLFERARAAEEDGKPSVARTYYEMAARRASGELKQQALARLAALRGETSR